MLNRKVAVIDYGVGNLQSVLNALEFCGGEPYLIENSKQLEQASRVILPGVGAFLNGMAALGSQKLDQGLKRYAETGRPLLGICLGMQLLFDSSEEFEGGEGLGLIPGQIKQVPAVTCQGNPHKIPHIGWNKLSLCKNNEGINTLFTGLSEDDYMYFLHSFTAVPEECCTRLADTYYNGQLISAAIAKDNLFGCQFHPEKSGKKGLRILANFLNLT